MMLFLRQIPRILFIWFFMSLVWGFSPNTLDAQDNFWQDVPQPSNKAKSASALNHFRLVQLEAKGFQTFIKSIQSGQVFEAVKLGSMILLPLPDGSWQRFQIVEHAILSPDLAAKLPDVKTFAGIGIDDPSASLRMDWTSHGFHAMVISPSGTVYIDPYTDDNQENMYAVFYKKDMLYDAINKKSFVCQLNENPKNKPSESKKGNSTHQNTSSHKNEAKASGTSLRTYRLAVAATGEYTQFHGGTVASAQNAIVTTINRINGIYNRELAIGFTLVDNSTIVFTNATTDPFNNDDPGLLIDESQEVIDDSVGTLNYDIGHTFSTGAGGLAALGVVCIPNFKARGVTGVASPVGDAFDVDYVAHEIGHQFGAAHTFNSVTEGCFGNRSFSAAYEPGSGSTIMAYAGLCDTDNIQNNSNDYFHAKSFDEIVDFSTTSEGNNCPLTTATGNRTPVVDAGISGLNIPIGTPFALTGSATDADGDELTYCWEQFDLGPAGSPNTPSGNAPIFRSFAPVASPTRTFPKLSDILNNTQTLGEILPSYTRTLTFRLTVRDDQPVGGVDNDQTILNVIGQAGPFLITAPNSSQSWTAATTQTITWDVAKTNQSPINCTQVNILLSTDGGQTFSTVLAAQTPNDGTQRVVVPNLPGTQNRIKIEAVGNVFFDISNANFTIVAPPQPTFSLLIPSDKASICAPNAILLDVQLAAFGAFTENVNLSVNNLPAGATANFSKNNFVPTSDNVVLTIGNTAGISTGAYTIQVTAVSGTQSKNQTVSIEINNGVPIPSLLDPTNGNTGLALKPTLDWQDAPLVASYEVQIAKDADFDQVVEIGSNLTQSSYELINRLDQGITYFWRVKAFNICGEGSFSSVFSFQTVDCQSGTTYQSTEVPKTISASGNPTVNSTLTIQQNYQINDVNVVNLQIDHTYIKDLTVKLISPAGTKVTLFDQICNDENNIRVNLDDEAVQSDFLCPPTDMGFYQPDGVLGDFTGESTVGDWTLEIFDGQNLDGGTLLSWGLEICATDQSGGNTPPFVSLNDGLISFPKSGGHVIENTQLQAGDNEDNAANLTYALQSLPTQGSLRKNSTILSTASSFTQADIDSGLINYLPNNSQANLEDSFVFIIKDSDDFQSLRDTFEIVLDIANPIEEFLPEAGLNVYPNPSSDVFELNMDFAARGEFTIKVYDLTGKLIQTSKINKLSQKEIYSLDISQNASGIYLLEFIGEKGMLKRRLMKVN